jgi:FkbM family methyltransferase
MQRAGKPVKFTDERHALHLADASFRYYRDVERILARHLGGRTGRDVRGGDMTIETPPGWIPPTNFEERLKRLLVPPSLYIRYKAQKEWRRGEPEYRLLDVLVDRRRNAVDAGANKGTYTYALAKLAKHVWAFEPNPKMFDILRRSAAANVTASMMALSDRSESAEFRVPRMRKGGFSNQGGSLSTTKITQNYAAVAVETRRLDDLALDDIGFVKIDVEGFEQEVLDGARETIRRSRPTMLIEMEERYTKVPMDAALRRVLDLGYAGMFMARGTLRPLEQYAAMTAGPDAAHVTNFIFLPK